MTTQSSEMVKRRGADTGPIRPLTTREKVRAILTWLAISPLYFSLWAFARVFKRVPDWLLRKLLRDHQRTVERRQHDVRIPADPYIPAYMLRWWRIKRNRLFNIYYHIVRRSDDDRALHDHPWWSFSIVLEGSYFEHCINAGGVNVKTKYEPGAVRFRPSGRFAHRLELEHWPPDAFPGLRGEEKSVHTIFITGPYSRRWGFHDGPRGWVDAHRWDEHCEKHGLSTAMEMKGCEEQNARP